MVNKLRLLSNVSTLPVNWSVLMSLTSDDLFHEGFVGLTRLHDVISNLVCTLPPKYVCTFTHYSIHSLPHTYFIPLSTFYCVPLPLPLHAICAHVYHMLLPLFLVLCSLSPSQSEADNFTTLAEAASHNLSLLTNYIDNTFLPNVVSMATNLRDDQSRLTSTHLIEEIADIEREMEFVLPIKSRERCMFRMWGQS